MAKFLLVIYALIAVCAASEPEGIFYSEKYLPPPIHVPSATLHNGSFTTRLDHFRPQDSRTVAFHYRLNIDHYREGGPIFIFVNAADETTTQWIESGLVVDVAERVGGALVTADHRYVRQNIPTATASFEDLQYLTVEQAVADIATLVVTVFEHLGRTGSTPVILWGSGYGGALATFARKKYPHLVTGVFASSGTFRAEVFDTTYHDNLSANLRDHGGLTCHALVQNSFDILLYLMENGATDYIQERLRLCDPVDNQDPQEVGLLFELFIDLISNYIRRYQLFGLDNFCRDMNYYYADPLNSLIRWAIYAYGYDFQDCINSDYNELAALLAETDWEASAYPRLRAYSYLRCTQIAAFRITSDYEMTAFPSLLTAEYHYQFCEDIFGPSYNRSALQPAVEHLNIQFGGQEQVVPYVIFTNAGLDPWVGHGVSEYDTHEGEVIFLYYATAGQDLSSINLGESVELTLAKQRITDTLVRWASV